MAELFKFQKQAIAELQQPQKHLVVMATGSGKTSVMMNWLRDTGKPNVLIVTTASKRDSGDMLTEAEVWCGVDWRKSLSSFSVIGWAGLAKFVQQLSDYQELSDYAVAFDEVACAKAGVQSQRGKAFLAIAKYAGDWAGFTATPGDKWIDFQAYAVATGLERNLTAFRNAYCIIATYKGFPEITGYRDTDKLAQWWDSVSVRPDTAQMFAELPTASHKTVRLPMPKGYKQVVKTRETLAGDFIETNMALCHYLRQLCVLDKARKQWLSDYMETNPENTVFFTNYKEEAEMVAEVHHKLYPRAKAWRIDGAHHDIPTAETIGKHDIVVANYQSGSEGLNLQFMRFCVFVSPNYSYSTSKQAKGRIARIGQTRPMVYYSLVADGTIEEDIMKCLHNKKDFTESLWAPKEVK